MKFVLLILALLLVACANLPTPDESRQHADSLAFARGWLASVIPSDQFDLVTFAPAKIERGDTLTVYIEGDGLAWLTSSQSSFDPTPREPLALQLALAQPEGQAAYLARPCQYVDAPARGCNQHYWTVQRFAPEVVAASSRALDVLKERFGAEHLILVGYSGGGAVAALLAARRKDVQRLITVAGNLDHRAWTMHHRVSPLTGSLNPADEWEALNHIPQWHFVGSDDQTMPKEITQGYANGFTKVARPKVIVIPGYSHRCCWAENWGVLWRRLL